MGTGPVSGSADASIGESEDGPEGEGMVVVSGSLGSTGGGGMLFWRSQSTALTLISPHLRSWVRQFRFPGLGPERGLRIFPGQHLLGGVPGRRQTSAASRLLLLRLRPSSFTSHPICSPFSSCRCPVAAVFFSLFSCRSLFSIFCHFSFYSTFLFPLFFPFLLSL